ncbi:MAG: UbiD family decarboxylase [Anaerolineales bacterium]|nr:UbiD family decarboxylase [Anaerolineales bacterium]
MSLRKYLARLQAENKLVTVAKPISKTYQIAGLLKQLEPQPVLCEQVAESDFRVAGNLFCTKADFAAYFDIPVAEIIPTLTRAIENRKPCEVVTAAPCQEVVIEDPDLDALPVLKHCELDGGNYISSGVFVAAHPEHGQNVDFHRAMQFSKTEMAVRIVRGRNFDAFLQDLVQVDVAICIGNLPNVLAAAATSVELGVNELEIANALEALPVVKARTVDVFVPAETEFVIEGTVYRDRRHTEGPFVDLTETYDVIREEPVLVVKCITHRRDAIWHALLPGALEHKLLMGMPREPTIFREVNKVVKCLDVNVNPGGCSWLHAIVQIDKQHDDDGKKAIEAAFRGHTSCKHIYVVDADVDIYNPLAVEWALATRFQGDVDLVVKDKAPGSSLDPSAEPGTKMTTRVGFDLTKPLVAKGKNFEKAPFPQVDVEEWID